MGLTGPAAALLDEWREAGKRCRLFPADRAQFRHAQDKGECGPLADPRYAQHELEAPRQVGMAAECRDQAAKFVGPARPQSLDICRYDVAQALITDMFEACLQAGDVRFHLLDERQLVAEPIQARFEALSSG